VWKYGRERRKLQEAAAAAEDDGGMKEGEGAERSAAVCTAGAVGAGAGRDMSSSGILGGGLLPCALALGGWSTTAVPGRRRKGKI
jgi:hypothetical protein